MDCRRRGASVPVVGCREPCRTSSHPRRDPDLLPRRGPLVAQRASATLTPSRGMPHSVRTASEGRAVPPAQTAWVRSDESVGLQRQRRRRRLRRSSIRSVTLSRDTQQASSLLMHPLRVETALEPTEEIRRVFSPPFSVTYTIRLTHSPSPSLTTTLTVLNPPSSSPLRFQALLHSYLRLPGSSRPKDVKVSGLKGASFVDKVGGPKEDKEGRELVGFEAGEVDRVYSNVPSTIEVEYGGGKGITLQTSSLPDVRPQNRSVAAASLRKLGASDRTAHRMEPRGGEIGRDEGHGGKRLGTLRLHRARPDDLLRAQGRRQLGG